MKIIFQAFFLLFVAFTSYSQVKIGGPPALPQAGAMLELDAGGTNKGLLLTRLTNSQMLGVPLVSNSHGMLVYNTDSNCLFQYRGSSIGWESLCKTQTASTACLPTVLSALNSNATITGTAPQILATLNYTASDTAVVMLNWFGSAYNLTGPDMDAVVSISVDSIIVATTVFDDRDALVDDAGAVGFTIRIPPGIHTFRLQARKASVAAGNFGLPVGTFQAIVFTKCGTQTAASLKQTEFIQYQYNTSTPQTLNSLGQVIKFANTNNGSYIPNGTIAVAEDTITLQPGRSYSLKFSAGQFRSDPNNYTVVHYSWFNNNTNLPVGIPGEAYSTGSSYSGDFQSMRPFAEALVNVTTTTSFSVRVTFLSILGSGQAVMGFPNPTFIGFNPSVVVQTLD